MRIGLIARADATGLGIQSKEFFDHIPCKALVIDSGPMAPALSEILKPNLSWYPGQKVVELHPPHRPMDWMPRRLIEEFISDIDILFAMETPYDYRIFDICRERGVKTILQFNYEFLDYPSHLPRPDLLAAPSMWNYDQVPERKVFLPVPVNTKKFSTVRKEKTFVHISGRPAVHDRNGTKSLLESLRLVENHIDVIIRSQRNIGILSNPHPSDNRINVDLDCGNKKNYFDNYTGGVLVMPRKYGGLCLPMNEAIAAGMPVITTDISPNNNWLPQEWLVPASSVGSFMCKKKIDLFEINRDALAKKIDQFCDPDFYNTAVDKALGIRENISWEALMPLYKSIFTSLLQ